MNEQQVKDNVKLHLLVLIWGFTAILGALISLPPVEIVFFRTLISAISLMAVLIFTRVYFYVKVRDLLIVVGIGALIGAHWVLFFLSARVSTISICLVGMATASLWTSLLEPIFNKRRVQFHEVFFGLLVIVGLFVIFQFESGHWLGLVLAILSAFLAALFSVFNGMLTKKYDHRLITFYEMIGACLSIVLFFPIYKSYFTNEILALDPQPMDWVYLVILAVVCTVYAYSQWIELMKRLSVYAINLVVNLEPVYGIILALMIFGENERMNEGFYIGTFIIILTVISYPLFNRRLKNKAGKVKRIF